MSSWIYKLHALCLIPSPRHLRIDSKPWCTFSAHLVVGKHFWCLCCGLLHGSGRGGDIRVWADVCFWFMVTFGLAFAFGWGFVFVFGLAFGWCSWLHSGWPLWIWGSWSQSDAWWPCCQHGPAGCACGTARKGVQGSIPKTLNLAHQAYYC